MRIARNETEAQKDDPRRGRITLPRSKELSARIAAVLSPAQARSVQGGYIPR